MVVAEEFEALDPARLDLDAPLVRLAHGANGLPGRPRRRLVAVGVQACGACELQNPKRLLQDHFLVVDRRQHESPGAGGPGVLEAVAEEAVVAGGVS
jgi:hypothetical protein